ncbi:MAG: hypothetical protein KBC44_00585 [Candidatus Pacebacteria bacterium]|nr:hypothetical protein [Candidatus Paceibacterota bacterium]MBP9839463.1 hypothetical protein [Candidatus Paceibacterota bacterium]
MNKFEGIMNKALGYDSEEVKNPEQAETRRDIRERAKFPPHIQDILSRIERLGEEESKIKDAISETRKSLKNQEDEAILDNLEKQLRDVQNREIEISRDLMETLSKDRKLHEQFSQYMAKIYDAENPPEELKFSDN